MSMLNKLLKKSSLDRFSKRLEDLRGELIKEFNHIADEWRYFCMSKPIPPRTRKVSKPPVDDPLNMLSDNNSKLNDWRNY